MTPADLVEHLRDKQWRLRNLYWIVDKSGQRVKYVPNPMQQELYSHMHGRDVILKARQLGVTTAMCIDALDDCLFHADHRAAIIAHRMDDARAIFETKVKFPYENTFPFLRERVRNIRDSADTLTFDNGSSISVTTSARSGTLQRLHVSEFGKICSQFPNKAREIVSGSFPAAEQGVITVESTAEGQEGKFYQLCQQAQDNEALEALGPKDWRFHFFPWWREPRYVYEPSLVVETAEDEAYFAKLEHEEGVELTPRQRAWWVKTEREQGADMKREYPATPAEAFEQAIEGCYFEMQLAYAVRHGHIGKYPYDPRFMVNSFWDLGRNDLTTIWLHQWVEGRNRFIAYYEGSGEHISHYCNWLQEWARSEGDHKAPVRWGDHYWPHDGGRQDLFLYEGRVAEAEKHGIRPSVVERPVNKLESIEAARSVFPSCDFDERACAIGLKRLRHYRKEWDDMRGIWKDRPRHDENSHGADSFQTFALGWKPPVSVKLPPRKRNAWAA